jgi:hypothetical protein
MFRCYWKSNKTYPIIKTKEISRIDGGYWFSEESDNRKVYIIHKRINFPSGILEEFSLLDDNFINLPCWKDSTLDWKLHKQDQNVLLYSLNDYHVLEVTGKNIPNWVKDEVPNELLPKT